ncbi:methyl-accepting chemotaxis protein CtpH [Cellvibrio zantedeschiae]|uniref:Methyl-accepting chemotaxis protein CtpH n=1 Tax=Cellvibrio zantedeschiae TaxID=1237077 RepID=A0ABQ3B7U6_9GAMM|nr:methyl-accepting chemotaxis protein [Cellvibrio zantedeschiae]GGY83710.1 methyl-accepting chemotaxis protein CtpH [Cellvibrio zantedeschiae]
MNGLFSSVQSRLTVLVGGGIGVLLLVASVAVFQLKSHLNEYHQLISHSVEFERGISELNLSYKTQIQEWKNVLLRGKDSEKLQKYWDQFSALQKEIQAKGESLGSKLPNDDSKKLLQDFLRAHAAAYPKYESGLNAFKAADFDPAAGDKAVTGIDREPSKMLSDCATFIHKIGTETNTKIESGSATVVFWSQLLVALFGIAIIALVLITLKNSFVTPLLAVIKHIELLAQGNFKTRLHLNQQGELGELNHNIDRMQDSLISVINAVKQSSNTLNNSSQKITDVARAISVDTDNSHKSTDQVAAAINEMTSTVQEVANNASGAANAAQEADEHARKGVEIMDSTIASIQQLSEEVDNVSTAMTQLETETGRIGGVLDVIKNVAEQTNLLALNAAIEAARAGEQGRGFAVVADEVRALAKRTQESTAEIQHIIQAVQQGASKAMNAMKVSQTKTQNTSEMAGQAGQAISSITEAVARIHMMNTQIATAAEEQSYAAEEINKNVVRVVNLVESAANNAQKSTHVATELNSVARELERQITHFNH